MRAKKTLLLSALSCIILLAGCGANTTPEIIMPEQPMVSAATADPSPAAQQTTGGSTDAGTAKPDTPAPTTASSSYTVYLITMDLTDSYWKSIDDGCLSAVNEIGNITYKWTGPDAHDDALQSACIDDAVADGANAILLAANSRDGVNASLEKAASAGCRIVYVDSAASYDCVTALSTDNNVAGKTAAETMIHALQEKGITSGTIGVMGVTADTASCVARENGFREAFEGTDFTLADTVFMLDDAGNVTSAVNAGLAQSYVGFFGTNEGTTVAIGNAIKEAAVESVVVGFDTSDAVLSLVADGTIYATMQQNPQVMGHDGMSIAIQALEGTYTDTNTNTDALGTEKLRVKIDSLLGTIQSGMLKLTEAVEQLNTMSGKNVTSAKEMSSSIEQIYEKANSQEADTRSAANDVETTRNAIDMMLEQIEQINLLSQHMESLSENSRNILSELTESSRNSRETVTIIEEQVTVTNESVEQIKSVTEYITNIADETNLLALNASIEAARAGEAGKGFAVVAQEIQKLAAESNKSAAQIGQNIQSLVEKTNGIVTVMDTIKATLENQEVNIDKTGQIFSDIASDIHQITEKEIAMQTNVANMNLAKDNVSRIISDLSESAVDNAALSQTATDATNEMMQEIESLGTLAVDLTELAGNPDGTLTAFLSVE